MALVTCSGCGRLVSDKVETCIYCGKSIAKKSNYALDLDLNYIHSLVKNKNGLHIRFGVRRSEYRFADEEDRFAVL